MSALPKFRDYSDPDLLTSFPPSGSVMISQLSELSSSKTLLLAICLGDWLCLMAGLPFDGYPSVNRVLPEANAAASFSI